MKGIWIVDDDQSIRWVLERAVQREGMSVRCFDNAQECLSALEREAPQVLVSDIRMPGTNGLELLERVRSQRPALPVIITTAYSDLDSAVSAFRGGAFEYLPKPFDLSHAMELIRRAVQESGREAVESQQELVATDMLGQAPAMQEVFRAIGRLASSSVTVLITGESGTGKELVARALHRHSLRAKGPFVALNTAAIPKDLLESELFGHERGSFTGAQQQRRGRFEQAESGTLFLDEIGDMPPELQTRLLRVLADGQFYRVGGQQALQANVRVIAATHQDLEQRVHQGQFREDLFHRLNVIRLRLPALRERIEDIPLLSRHFLQRSAKELGVEVKRLSDEAQSALCRFFWPGNVRQLENTCHWISVMAPAQVVEVKDLPAEFKQVSYRVGITGSITGTNNNSLASINSPAALPGSAGPSGLPDQQSSSDFHRLETARSSSLPRGEDQSLGASMPEVTEQITAWEQGLVQEVQRSLAGQTAVPDDSRLMDDLTRRFESLVIRTALRYTRGRRIDAASRLGIGRNTITRKIQELKLEDDHW
ncbi:MAG: nitrogen regulation protein NR(I) [Betaproteobacteria bacterium]|jgi:two-component system, NtrC family, nitrogen regulation response regulator GlnG|nr:nitrogen regulation protein NR(I) [Betaproteobacteria bacterium]